MDFLGKVPGYILAVIGDYVFIKLLFQGISVIKQIPNELPKRANVEGLAASLLAVIGSTSLFFHPLSRMWFIFMIIDLFGLGVWGWLDFTMLVRLVKLRYEGRLAEANWFHKTFYPRYLRKVISESEGI